jgi:CheY-like chemotaxis protein
MTGGYSRNFGVFRLISPFDFFKLECYSEASSATSEPLAATASKRAAGWSFTRKRFQDTLAQGIIGTWRRRHLNKSRGVMFFTWYRTWLRRRRSRCPKQIHPWQSRLTFEKLEDRRLLSATLFPSQDLLAPDNPVQWEDNPSSMALVQAPAPLPSPVSDAPATVSAEVPAEVQNQDHFDASLLGENGTKDSSTRDAFFATMTADPVPKSDGGSSSPDHAKDDLPDPSSKTVSHKSPDDSSETQVHKIETESVTLQAANAGLGTEKENGGDKNPGQDFETGALGGPTQSDSDNSGDQGEAPKQDNNTDTGEENPNDGDLPSQSDATKTSDTSALTDGQTGIAGENSSSPEASAGNPISSKDSVSNQVEMESSPAADRPMAPAEVQTGTETSRNDEFFRIDFSTEIDDLPQFNNQSGDRLRNSQENKTPGDLAPANLHDARWNYLATALSENSRPAVFVAETPMTVKVSFQHDVHLENFELAYALHPGVGSNFSVVGPRRILPRTAPGAMDEGLGEGAAPGKTASNALLISSAKVELGSPTRTNDAIVVASAAPVLQMEPSSLEGIVRGPNAGRLNATQEKTGSHQGDSGGWWIVVSQFVILPQFPNNHQPTIVLALADEHMLDAFNVALVKENFMVLTASTAGEVMKQLKSATSGVDVTLLDMELPDVNGVNLLTKLRETYSHLPVMACADSVPEKDIEKLAELGVLHLFTKPINLEDFLAKVRELVQPRIGLLEFPDAPIIVALDRNISGL